MSDDNVPIEDLLGFSEMEVTLRDLTSLLVDTFSVSTGLIPIPGCENPDHEHVDGEGDVEVIDTLMLNVVMVNGDSYKLIFSDDQAKVLFKGVLGYAKDRKENEERGR